jgi:hypothetical protein
MVRRDRPKTVLAILEDNAESEREMRAVLAEALPRAELVVAAEAPVFIAWLAAHLTGADLLSLDHDLGQSLVDADGARREPGDGRDVARWLVAQPWRVPVVIHTTNSRCGGKMEVMFQEAGWRVQWTPPFGDPAWIRRSWIRRVVEMLGA